MWNNEWRFRRMLLIGEREISRPFTTVLRFNVNRKWVDLRKKKLPRYLLSCNSFVFFERNFCKHFDRLWRIFLFLYVANSFNIERTIHFCLAYQILNDRLMCSSHSWSCKRQTILKRFFLKVLEQFVFSPFFRIKLSRAWARILLLFDGSLLVSIVNIRPQFYPF